MGDERQPAPVDPLQLLKALSPLLGQGGEIKGTAELDRVMTLMKDTTKAVKRSTFINILKETKNAEILERFCLGRGGWDVLYSWLEDAKKDNNIKFLIELLNVYLNIPVTVDILQKNSTPRTIKSLKKVDSDEVKALAIQIVAKWTDIINKNDKKKSKHRDDKHKHRSSHHGHASHKDNKERRSSNAKDSKENAETETQKKDAKLDTSNKQSATPSSSKDIKSKEDQPRTAKVAPSVFRSTGLETETVLPPAKKKSSIGSDKILSATKRPSNGKLSGVAPEKKLKPTPAPIVTKPAPTNTASKIKIIPARPQPVFDSSDFMEALSASTNPTATRRKKTVRKNPTSPTTKGPVKGKDGTATSPPPDNSGPPSFYKEASPNLEDKDGDTPMTEGRRRDSEDPPQDGDNAPAENNEESAKQSGSSKKKKKVSWAAEDKLVKTFWFEMNEDERVNVNKVRAFEDVRRQETLMERKTMDASKYSHDQGQQLWRRPAIISDIIPAVQHGCNSTEKEAQRLREGTSLQAIYFAKELIPDSAQEPETVDTPKDVAEPKIIPLHDENGGGETFVDHSNTPMPKPGGMAPLQPTPPAAPTPLVANTLANTPFALPANLANILENMATQLQNGHPPAPSNNHAHNTGPPLPEGVQQMLYSILDQNPQAARDEGYKAQLMMMMESGPIREQIQAWANGMPPQGGPPGGPQNWGPPPPPPPQHTGGGLLPHPNMPPASMLNGPPMHGPPRGPPHPHFQGGPGGWGSRPPMGGPQRGLRGGPHRGLGGGPRRGLGGGRGGGRGAPRILCKKFPNCPYGMDCKFLHPGENGPL